MRDKAIAKRLGDTGICVCPNYFSPDKIAKTKAKLTQIQMAGGFQDARIGKSPSSSRQNYRNDKIHWLHQEEQIGAQIYLWKKIDSLKLALNRSLYLGIRSFEGHYAIYPPGGFYGRHLDQFKEESSRTVSFILYLNQSWNHHHGGRLRVFSNDAFDDIDPIAGTMVCFLSAEVEHEVLKSHRSRCSFVGWFKR